MVRRAQMVFGGEPGVKAPNPQIQPRQQAFFTNVQHLRLMAPVKTPWVGRDIVDQRKHTRCGMFDKSTALDDGH